MTYESVLITGASSGIGAEIARQFSSSGVRVILLARNEDKLTDLVNDIRASGGEAHAYAVDVGVHEDVVEIASQIKVDVGIPSVIINNAGGGKWRFIEETEYEEAVEMIKAPYLGAFFITKAFMPEMLERNSGHIVNVTSIAAITPFSGATAYTASRKAMLGFHEALSADLYGTGIRTSLAYFAKIESSFWANNPGSEERIPASQKMIPVISEQEAAKAIVNGVNQGKRVITAPFMSKVVTALNYLSPPITRLIMNLTGYKRR